MRQGFLVGRLMALPLRHKLIAAGIVVAFIGGYTVWARRLPPQKYTSSALLFFDRTAAPKPDPGKVHTDQVQATELAKSILSDDLVKAICDHFGLFPGSRGGEATRFRSNLMLSRESTSSLRVTWRGTDRGQTVAVANTVAVLLTSWVPDAAHQRSDPAAPGPAPPSTPLPAMTPIEPKPPVETSPAKPTPAKAHLEKLLTEEKELQSLLASADKRLAALGDEAHRLEASIEHANTERETNIAARQPLTEQLATEKRTLDLLRARYTDAYPDVEAAQERVKEAEQKLAAMPVRPAPDADQNHLNAMRKELIQQAAAKVHWSNELSKKARLESVLRSQEVKVSGSGREGQQASTEAQPKPTDSSRSRPSPAPALTAPGSPAADLTGGEQVRVFKILERAANAQPTNNPRRLGTWLAVVAGPMWGVLYLLLAVWWFRAVSNAETLERIVPENVAYLGAIPGMNAWRHSV